MLFFKKPIYDSKYSDLKSNKLFLVFLIIVTCIHGKIYALSSKNHHHKSYEFDNINIYNSKNRPSNINNQIIINQALDKLDINELNYKLQLNGIDTNKPQSVVAVIDKTGKILAVAVQDIHLATINPWIVWSVLIISGVTFFIIDPSSNYFIGILSMGLNYLFIKDSGLVLGAVGVIIALVL